MSFYIWLDQEEKNTEIIEGQFFCFSSQWALDVQGRPQGTPFESHWTHFLRTGLCQRALFSYTVFIPHL